MAIVRSTPSRSGLTRLAQHYLEMVLAMVAGMAVYGMVLRGDPLSRSLGDEALMALFMTVPMVAWMRYRGHAWRQTAEMTVAMLAPGILVFVLLAGQPGVPNRALMLSSHGAMLAGMLALMVVRRGEYGHPGVCHSSDGAEVGWSTRTNGERP